MKIPKYRLHPNGQAFIQHKSIDRPQHRIYLGKHGTPESHERYEEAIKKIRLGGSPISNVSSLKGDVKIAEVAEAYLAHADGYYRQDGEHTTEFRRVVCAVGPDSPLIELFAAEKAADFGPLRLKGVRDRWISQGLSRGTINDYVGLVRRMFRWASENEMIPPHTYHGLMSVAPLRSGRSDAVERPDVAAVTLADAAKCFPWLRVQCQQMATVQFWCGMRPQDVCRLRGDRIDRSGDVWLYSPKSHKTGWRGHKLVKGIPTPAQQVLTPLIDEHGDGYLFPTKVKGAKHPHVTPDNYSCAVLRACRKAKEKGVAAPQWSPNQLRHGIATLVSTHLGHEAAQLWLGHKDPDTTKIYLEKEISQLVAIARQVQRLAAG